MEGWRTRCRLDDTPLAGERHLRREQKVNNNKPTLAPPLPGPPTTTGSAHSHDPVACRAGGGNWMGEDCPVAPPVRCSTVRYLYQNKRTAGIFSNAAQPALERAR